MIPHNGCQQSLPHSQTSNWVYLLSAVCCSLTLPATNKQGLMKLELVVKLELTLQAAAFKAVLLEIGFLLGAWLIDTRIHQHNHST